MSFSHDLAAKAQNLRKLSQLVSIVAIAAVIGACNAQPSPTAVPSGAGANNPNAGKIPASVSDPSNSPCIGVQPDPNVTVPTGGSSKQWTKPEVVTYSDRVYCAILTTKNGRIVAELFPQIAPANVNSFVFLAQQGFYDGVTFHRVLEKFMAQTGDPTGSGSGGPGYNNLPLEVNPAVLYDKAGRIGAARTNDPNSAGSQFFITFNETPNLNNAYTIIGQVVEGMNTVRQISLRDPNTATTVGDTLISVRVVEAPKK